jgi:glutaredoxin
VQEVRIPIVVSLYTRSGCHLCEDAETELRRLVERFARPAGNQIELRLIDVDRGDPQLREQYDERVPVLVIGDREYGAPLPPALLERALRTALDALQDPA